MDLVYNNNSDLNRLALLIVGVEDLIEQSCSYLEKLTQLYLETYTRLDQIKEILESFNESPPGFSSMRQLKRSLRLVHGLEYLDLKTENLRLKRRKLAQTRTELVELYQQLSLSYWRAFSSQYTSRKGI